MSLMDSRLRRLALIWRAAVLDGAPVAPEDAALADALVSSQHATVATFPRPDGTLSNGIVLTAKGRTKWEAVLALVAQA